MKRLLLAVVLIAGIALAGRVFLSPGSGPGGGSADGAGRPDSGAAATRVYVADVWSESTAEGAVWHVRPTRAGRLADRAELDVAWKQAVAAGVPGQTNLRQQFLCHPLSVIARAKPTWDLEEWRPAVGGVRTMLQACNP